MVGDPGVGKSSLNLRICANVATTHKVLYVTGEKVLVKFACELID